MTSQPESAPVSAASYRSQFELSEAARRRNRTARFDQAAQARAESTTRHRYYGAELERLVRSLVPPGSKVLEVGVGSGDLLAAVGGAGSVGVDVSPRSVALAKERHPELDLRVLDVEHDALPEGPFDTILLSDAIGMLDDIQAALERLHKLLRPEGRIVVTYYNFVWEPALKLAERIGLKTHWPDQNWLSMDDIENLLYLTGYELFRHGTDILMPAHLPVLSTVLNRIGAQLPVARDLALVDYFVARAVPETLPQKLPTVSVICPCRNEKGNIREAVARTPVMGSGTELIFVDGNSSDGTVEEIETVIREYRGPLTLRFIPQGDGKGKGDAVRKGFAIAQNDILMILDSDLTVPPEDLPKFYQALVSGKGEFINGVRLVYPMEGEAMRFLNLLGNKFFSSALSWLLEQPIKDSLCGTKVLYRTAYELIASHRHFFGDFDPFGDFDLLFGAARLNMRIVDLPVRYRARTYGETKISRFSHGWLLLKMTAFGFKKLRMGL
ncbi:MAG TPA: bifunctional class I SAM-dependent methyltransferase/glycosyltransferase family 2 protein [Polyangiaceae bacterium]|nr:bifunctional class I SAM-dependent methyltransferase/glycosyltransferase family 2 protein [Polyangiaceae bacterium]